MMILKQCANTNTIELQKGQGDFKAPLEMNIHLFLMTIGNSLHLKYRQKAVYMVILAQEYFLTMRNVKESQGVYKGLLGDAI